MKKDKGAVMMIYKSMIGKYGQSKLNLSLIYYKIHSSIGVVPYHDLCHAVINTLIHCGRVNLF